MHAYFKGMHLNEPFWNGNQPSLPIPLTTLQRNGVPSKTTLWRWRRKGWLRTVNISGRAYVTPEAISEFNDRASQGEFATRTHLAIGGSNE